ncbi:terpene cyclase [Pleurotus pulmonarius]|nr:terpene cyclase [Pleurotus pulmonarius]
MEITPLRPDLTALEDAASIDVYLPRTLESWPWPRRINPHYAKVKQRSSAWYLLASLAYPDLDRAGCRVGCDLMNLFFCIDEYTDLATADVARAEASIVMDAIRSPYNPRPFGEWIIGEMARQFWANAILIATPLAQARFVDSFQTYLDAVVQQAEDRAQEHVRSTEDYFQLRRETIGAKPAFAVGELYMNIPQEVIDHPVISKLSELCVDMLIIGNDICSYHVEWQRGDEGHNLVTVVMQQFGVNVQEAMDRSYREFT